MMSRTGSKSGFSLLEVLVATVILSVGVVFLFPSFFLATDVLMIARDRLVVQSWAENRLWEEGRALQQVGRGAVGAGSGDVLLGKRMYTWEKRIEEIDPGLSAVTLTVRWAAGGRPREGVYTAWVATGPG